MRPVWATLVVTIFATGAHAWDWPWASADEKANRLFVEASALWSQYHALPANDFAKYGERIQLLTEVDDKLNRIAQDHPESTLSVSFSISGEVGDLNPKKVKEIKENLESTFKCIEKIDSCTKSILDDALSIANSLSHASERAFVLAEIAGALAVSGHNAEAKVTISEAISVSQKISDPVEKSRLLTGIVGEQALAGDVDGALATIHQASDAYEKVVMIVKVIDAQVLRGDREGAIKNLNNAIITAKFIEEDVAGLDQDFALSYIAGAQARAGDLTGAVETINSIRIFSRQAAAMAEVYTVLATSANVDTATQAIEMITEKARFLSDGMALAEMANALAKSQDDALARRLISDALDAANQINDSYQRLHVFLKIADAQSLIDDRAGSRQNISRALTLLNTIEKELYRNMALKDIIVSLAGTGDILGAVETVELIQSPESQAFALKSISIAQVAEGDIAGALSTARSISFRVYQASALAAIAIEVAKIK